MAFGINQRVGDDGWAVVDDGREYTWAQVNADVNRVAEGLRARLGSGDRAVLLCADNGYEWLVTLQGVIHAGLRPVPVSPRLTPRELAHVLGDSQAALAFVDQRSAPTMRRAVEEVSGAVEVIAWGGVASPWQEMVDDAADVEPDPDVPIRRAIVYTSGTSGVPKAVELTWLARGAASVRAYFSGLREHPYARYGPHLVCGPLYHVGPMHGAWVLGVGTPIVVHGKFDAEAVVTAIERYRVGSALIVPTHLYRLHELPEEVRERHDLSTLQFVSHTGAPCPAWLKHVMIEWLGPILYEGYGGSEAGAVCRISAEEWLERPGSVGQVQPPYERAFAVDAAGNECPPGTTGLLYFVDPTGEGIRYLGDEPKTREAHLAPGVFTLGDLGYVDADGYVFISDRRTDLILSGGVNIYPAEAEAVLLGHPGVGDVAVIGVPDEEMGESVVALVVAAAPHAAPTAETLQSHCREHLAGYKCPKRIEYVTDLGRTDMGKIDKARLRQAFIDQAGQART